MPTSFSELLNHRYFVNEHWIAQAKELIRLKQYGDFEMSVDPDHKILYISV